MLEHTSILTYKVITQITPKHIPVNDADILKTILRYIGEYSENRFGFILDYERFCRGQSYKCDYQGSALRTSFLYVDRKGQETVRWAMYLRARDPFTKRRNWINHVGLEQRKEGSYTLYFAEYCTIHQAGSLALPKQPISLPPAVLRSLIRSHVVGCQSGQTEIVDYPMEISEATIDAFLEGLFDPERTIPIAVITCPDMVNPNLLISKTLGNLLVFCIDDYMTYDSLCKRLPPDLLFPWDSVKIYMPFSVDKGYHTLIPFQDIAQFGSDGITDAAYRAFCCGFTGEERRAFISLDSLYEELQCKSMTKMKVQTNQLQIENAKLKQENEKLVQSLEDANTRLVEAAEKFTSTDMHAYEELLEEAARDNEQFKRGIALLTERLCAAPKEMIQYDDLSETEELHNLALALQTFQRLNLSR